MTPEQRAEALWHLLDDIDSAYDMFSDVTTPNQMTPLEALWHLLDDIDSAYDMFSDVTTPTQMTPLEAYILSIAKKRFEYYESNGYRLKEVTQ